MQTVKMRAPAHASGFSHEGQNYEVVDGTVNVLESHVIVAETHGYEIVDGERPTSGRPAMVHSMVSSVRAVVESIADADLSSFLALPPDDQAKFWEGTAKDIVEYPKHLSAQRDADEEDRKAEEAEQTRLAAAKKQADEDEAAAKKAAEIDAAKKAAEADSVKKK